MEPVSVGLLGASLLGNLAGGMMQGRGAMEQIRAQERNQKLTREQLMAILNDPNLQNMGQDYIPLKNLLPGALEGLQQDYTTEYTPFEYKGNIQQFLDPSMAYQQEQMGKSLDQSAISRGNLLSGAQAKALQDRSAQLAQTDYGNAYNRMTDDRNFTYQDYKTQFQNKADNASNKFNQFKTLFDIGQAGLQGQQQNTSNLATMKTNAILQSQPNFSGAGMPMMQAGQTVQNLFSPSNINALRQLFGE